jgi:hypothetical protein
MSAKELTWLLGVGYMVLTAAIWQSEVLVTHGRKLHEVRWMYHLCFYGALVAAVKGYGWFALFAALPGMLIGGLLLNWTVGAIWMRLKVRSMERPERE